MQKNTLSTTLVFSLAVIVLVSSSVSARCSTAITVASPNHMVEAEIGLTPGLNMSVSYNGAAVLTHSSMGLKLKDEPGGGDWTILSSSKHSSDTQWRTVCGKNSTVRNHFNEAELVLTQSADKLPGLKILLRCYNDGVAFRYAIPHKPSSGSRRIIEQEQTTFVFPSDAECWAAGKDAAYETEYRHSRLSDIQEGAIVSLPLTIKLNSNLYAAVAEAELTDWAGAYLTGAPGLSLFGSGLMRGDSSPQHLSVPVAGLRSLVLRVGDGGDDFQFDHADWADAHLVAADGTITPLSKLRPTAASQGFGVLQTDRSVDGNPITLGSRTYSSGLGTHSNGAISYNLDSKYTRFEATVGIDAETRGKGSVVFSVSGQSAVGAGPQRLFVRLAPRTDGSGLVAWEGSMEKLSPWRVLMLGSTPGALVESELIENLSRPCALKDTSWIKPGMMAWDHWWSGDVKMDTATDERYIAFAGEMGWDYQLVDWQWYGPFDTPSADITHVNPSVDMPALLKYAKDRKVKLWVWLHSNDVDRFLKAGKLDAAFQTYHAWGLAGVKIDFMNRDDQEMVNWYETIVKLAADHQLMVDFHGAFKPTGLRRTYPNLMTREGVLGNEYNKFSNRITPEHTLTLPFTRMLVGPMDFTPGGFINVTQKQFKQTVPTQVIGSRCHQLAMFVVYDSPLCCVCDDPDNYRGQPGIEFLRAIPTSWDETHVIYGEVGSHIVTARRKGADWLVGGMCGSATYRTELPLRFLASGNYSMTMYSDAPDFEDNPMHITELTRTVTKADVLHVSMSVAGGVAIKLHKLP